MSCLWGERLHSYSCTGQSRIKDLPSHQVPSSYYIQPLNLATYAGKEYIDTMQRRKIDIFGMSETRHLGKEVEMTWLDGMSCYTVQMRVEGEIMGWQ